MQIVLFIRILEIPRRYFLDRSCILLHCTYYISRAAVLVKWCSTGVLALSLWCKDTEISLFRVIASQSSVYFTLKYFWDKNACYILNLVHRKLLIVNFNGLSGPVMKLLNILINMYYIIDWFCI